MPAYRVARSRITDPVEYKKYTDLVPGIIARFGGKVLARGGRFQIMERGWCPDSEVRHTLQRAQKRTSESRDTSNVLIPVPP